MSEIRKSAFTKQHVIMAPNRDDRPLPSFPPDPPEQLVCPFCLGNEHLTPPERARCPGGLLGKPWRIRVIDNLYPAVAPGMFMREMLPVGTSIAGLGIHEVIVDTPEHSRTAAQTTAADIVDVLQMLQDRIDHHRRETGLVYFAPFKNHRMRAGASLRHPHWQLIALSVVPREVRRQWNRELMYFEHHGRPLLTDIVEAEAKARDRVIANNDHAIAFAPYASQHPFEIWLAPKEPSAFGKHKPEFAKLLRDCLVRLEKLIANVPYNLVVQLPAPDCPKNASTWLLKVIPRIATAAGFELSTNGMPINTVLPEVAAQKLKAA
jgi:UDPglucose--hexose-1-phosphate uridylyltransferase